MTFQMPNPTKRTCRNPQSEQDEQSCLICDPVIFMLFMSFLLIQLHIAGLRIFGNIPASDANHKKYARRSWRAYDRQSG
jgi:hypothetical protein